VETNQNVKNTARNETTVAHKKLALIILHTWNHQKNEQVRFPFIGEVQMVVSDAGDSQGSNFWKECELIGGKKGMATALVVLETGLLPRSGDRQRGWERRDVRGGPAGFFFVG